MEKGKAFYILRKTLKLVTDSPMSYTAVHGQGNLNKANVEYKNINLTTLRYRVH